MRREFGLLFGLSLLLAGCGLIPGASLSPREARLQALAQHQAQWTSQGVDDYVFSVILRCFCPDQVPIDITVVDGAVTAVTRAGQPVRPDEVQTLPKTVPALFQVVADQADAFELSVEWDPTFGFPIRISVDAVENMADEEFSIEVASFRPAD